MKILIIHNRYQVKGGEDNVVEQERNILKNHYTIDTLFFENKKGILGLFQFIFSIWNLHSSYKVRKKIKLFRPDYVHIHNWHFAAGPLIIRTCHKMGVPVVHTVHNYRLLCPSGILLNKNKIFTDSINQNFPWTAIKEKVYRNSSPLTFWLALIIWTHEKLGTWKKINKFIFLTEFAADLYISSKYKIEKNKFIIKPNFLQNKNENINPNRDDHFLYIGRLTEEKGIKILIEAINKTSYKLKIAGEGPLTNFVINSCSKNKNIEYLGILNSDQVEIELKKCSALIFPSIWFEGMPMTIIEAFSNSTPVIASKIGAMSSMITHHENGLHFKVGDLKDLCDKLDDWKLMDESRKNKIREYAYSNFTSKYSTDNQYNYFRSIYF